MEVVCFYHTAAGLSDNHSQLLAIELVELDGVMTLVSC